MNLNRVFRRAEKLGATFCDIRTAAGTGTTLSYKDGELVKAVSEKDKGAGVRALYEGNWGFHSMDGPYDVAKSAENAVELAKGLASVKRGGVQLAPISPPKDSIPLDVNEDPRDVDISAKVELVKDLIDIFGEFPELNSAQVNLSDGVSEKRYFSSEGSEVSFYQSRVLLSAQLSARDERGVVGYRMRVGGTGGYELLDRERIREKAREAARSTIRLLGAGSAPSGRYTVIADPDLAGVFAHEAVGHATEGDLVLSGDSILKDRTGERIGSQKVTIFDDPTLSGGFGSFPYDDEGIRTGKKVLIEGGRLRQYLTNRETANALNVEAYGSARAQSCTSVPLVRMSNTMIDAGDLSFEELTEDIDHGIYLKGTRGGQVDTAKGMFQFNAQEGYLIEKGELTQPLRDVSLSGHTLETLGNIDALGDDLRFGSPGFCGKGQIVPVCDGGPHIRIVDAIVGGR